MARADFQVRGIARPKGSRRHFKNGGSKESSEHLPGWMDQVTFAAKEARPAGQTLEPPYAMSLVFTFPEPDNPKWPWPSSSDIDKLERGILDSLVRAELILDDRHVVEIYKKKSFVPSLATAGVRVAIE